MDAGWFETQPAWKQRQWAQCLREWLEDRAKNTAKALSDNTNRSNL